MIREAIFRGDEFIASLKTQPFFVFGCGALGANMIENLARTGARNIKALDFDSVEEDNLGTQPFGRKHIGQSKFKSIQMRIYEDLGFRIGGFTLKVDSKSEHLIKKELTKDSILIDCFDNTEARQFVTDLSNKEGYACIHPGLYGGYGQVTWNEVYKVPDDTGFDFCNYPLSRNNVLLTVTATLESVYEYMSTARKSNFRITSKDLQVTRF